MRPEMADDPHGSGHNAFFDLAVADQLTASPQ
jgi:hypothetical protein